MFGNYITVNCMSYKGSSVICTGWRKENKQTNKCAFLFPACYLQSADFSPCADEGGKWWSLHYSYFNCMKGQTENCLQDRNSCIILTRWKTKPPQSKQSSLTLWKVGKDKDILKNSPQCRRHPTEVSFTGSSFPFTKFYTLLQSK